MEKQKEKSCMVSNRTLILIIILLIYPFFTLSTSAYNTMLLAQYSWDCSINDGFVVKYLYTDRDPSHIIYKIVYVPGNYDVGSVYSWCVQSMSFLAKYPKELNKLPRFSIVVDNESYTEYMLLKDTSLKNFLFPRFSLLTFGTAIFLSISFSYLLFCLPYKIREGG